MPQNPSPTVQRWGVARWKRGTPPRHGALVASEVLLAILLSFVAVLIWLADLGLWLAVPATIAALVTAADAVREVRLLRRGGNRRAAAGSSAAPRTERG